MLHILGLRQFFGRIFGNGGNKKNRREDTQNNKSDKITLDMDAVQRWAERELEKEDQNEIPIPSNTPDDGHGFESKKEEEIAHGIFDNFLKRLGLK